ncbi:hypothetical protein [Cupriavidus sp. Marseille-Q8015]
MKSTNTQAMSEDEKKLLLEAAEYLSKDGAFMSTADALRAARLIRSIARENTAALSQPQSGEIEVEIESVGSCMLQTRRDGNGRLKVFMPQITVADIMQRVKVQAEHVDLRPAPYPAHGEPGALEQGDAL